MKTREDFCRTLLDDDSREALDPERLAARFVRYFNVPACPTMDELRSMLRRTGFGEVSGRHLDVKGIHYSAPGGGYDIHYRDDLWDGGQEFTVAHETYEIILETLWDMNSGDAPDRKVCREADRFAAAVLMQPRAFEPLALEWGLDVLALQRAFRCSYASVTIRLAEVLRRRPSWPSCTRGRTKGTPQAGPSRPTSGRRWCGGRGASGLPPPSPSPASGGASPAGAGPCRTAPWRSRPSATHGAVRPRLRLRRHSPARRLEGEAGKGGRHRCARLRPGRPRSPGDRLRCAGAQTASGGGGSLVAEGQWSSDVEADMRTA